jgi:hypothetical protein
MFLGKPLGEVDCISKNAILWCAICLSGLIGF